MLKVFLIFLAINSGLFVLANQDAKIETKPLDRILYERYFKRLYKYEPAVIRENNISYLEVVSKQKIGDSLISTGLNHKIEFRKDGRPIQMTEWFDYHRDSLISDFSYDSLGNLLECHIWKPTFNYRNGEMIKKDKSRNIFKYNNLSLYIVLNYDNNYSNRDLTLRSCDSLSYNIQNQKVSIFHGNSKRSIIIYKSNPTFIYPIHSDNTEYFEWITNRENEKPVDKESEWKLNCNYSKSVLKDLQKITGENCINRLLVSSVRGGGVNIFSTGIQPEITSLEFIKENMISDNNIIYVDTLQKLISVKQSFFISEPTSLENRNTSTNSIKTYDFAMRLVKIESVSQSSRGQFESSRDSSETYFTYYDFGLMKLKQEIHYNINHNGNQFNNEKSWIKEEETVIKRWNINY
jgi:hypothetical protein